MFRTVSLLTWLLCGICYFFYFYFTIFILQGRTVVRVTHRLLTVDGQVRLQVNPCEI